MAAIFSRTKIGRYTVITEYFGDERYETRIVENGGRIHEREISSNKSDAISANARFIAHVRYNLP